MKTTRLKSRHKYTEYLFTRNSRFGASNCESDSHIRWKMSFDTPWNPFASTNLRDQFKRVASDYYQSRKFDTLADAFSRQNERVRFLKTRYELNTNHVPSLLIKKGAAVGIEIECIIPTIKAKNIYEECKALGITGLTIASDSSIDGYNYEKAVGYELKLLINVASKSSIDNLKKLCALLKKMDAYVNKTCGLHIHLDQRHNNVAEALAVSHRLNNALFGLKFLVPKNRRDNNSYCALRSSYGRPFTEYLQELKKTQPDAYKKYTLHGENFDGSRYMAVNTYAYKQYKTIEVRLHSGTVRYDKIKNWIDILLNISNNVNFDDTTFYGAELQMLEHNKALMELFVGMLDLPETHDYLKDYMWSRWNKLKTVDGENEHIKTSILRRLTGADRKNALYVENRDNDSSRLRSTGRTIAETVRALYADAGIWGRGIPTESRQQVRYITNDCDSHYTLQRTQPVAVSYTPEEYRRQQEAAENVAPTRAGWDIPRPQRFIDLETRGLEFVEPQERAIPARDSPQLDIPF